MRWKVHPLVGQRVTLNDHYDGPERVTVLRVRSGGWQAKVRLNCGASAWVLVRDLRLPSFRTPSASPLPGPDPSTQAEG